MAASEHLGRQFLDRHLVEHHGWHPQFVRDYDDLEDPSSPHHEPGISHSAQALNEAHDTEHQEGLSWAVGWGGKKNEWQGNVWGYPVPHSHSHERIHFHDYDPVLGDQGATRPEIDDPPR